MITSESAHRLNAAVSRTFLAPRERSASTIRAILVIRTMGALTALAFANRRSAAVVLPGSLADPMRSAWMIQPTAAIPTTVARTAAASASQNRAAVRSCVRWPAPLGSRRPPMDARSANVKRPIHVAAFAEAKAATAAASATRTASSSAIVVATTRRCARKPERRPLASASRTATTLAPQMRTAFRAGAAANSASILRGGPVSARASAQAPAPALRAAAACRANAAGSSSPPPTLNSWATGIWVAPARRWPGSALAL
mgnify:CR=1 FL=1